jgi:DNA adenine methylase
MATSSLQQIQAPSAVSAVRDRPSLTPFLRWAGGKQGMVQTLMQFLPHDIKSRRYHEPFLGAGSLFLALEAQRAFLSDANEHLISTYCSVRDHWEQVSRYLQVHLDGDCEKYYYEVREQYNKGGFNAAQSARFIYLNKSCFNGIFRVNTKGKFNVPYGKKPKPAIPTKSELEKISNALHCATLRTVSFETALAQTRNGDFVYLDPPYPPLNGTAYFAHYTKDRFSADDQIAVAREFGRMDVLGCMVLMTNADTPLIRKLYRKYRMIETPVVRWITCKSVRHSVTELVITNY